MKLKWLLATCTIILAAATAAGLLSFGASPPGFEYHQVSAQELPRPMAVPVGLFEVTWASGVLEAANMYFPAELEALEVLPSEPTKQQAIDLAVRIGIPVSPETAAELPEQSIAEGGCYRWGFGSVDVNVFRDGNAGLVSTLFD
jgi:hypothetical protein